MLHQVRLVRVVVQYSCVCFDFMFARYSNPATDFRVLGVAVFSNCIGAKHQQNMCDRAAVCRHFYLCILCDGIFCF
jgi:hypothetical protein